MERNICDGKENVRDGKDKEYSKTIYIPNLNFKIMTHKPFKYSVDIRKN
jgi:hypothetical protein